MHPTYLKAMQLSKTQKWALGVMLIESGGMWNSRKGDYNNCGRPRHPYMVRRTTFNSLLRKEAVVMQDSPARPAYENAFIRAIAHQEAIAILEAEIEEKHKPNLIRETRLYRGVSIDKAAKDWRQEVLAAWAAVPVEKMKTRGGRILAYEDRYLRTVSMIDRFQKHAAVLVFAGLQSDYASKHGYHDFYPQHADRIKHALRNNWEFDTGWYAAKHAGAARISGSKERLDVTVYVENVHGETIQGKASNVADLEPLLDKASESAGETFAYWQQDDYRFLGGYDYKLDY